MGFASDHVEELSEWLSDKPLALGISGIIALSSTGEVRQFLEDRRTLIGLFSEEPIVDEREWLAFYDSPRTLERKFIDGVTAGWGAEVAEVMHALRNPRRAGNGSKAIAGLLVLASFLKLDQSCWKGIATELFDDSASEKLQAEVATEGNAEPIGNVALEFYLWVFLPCVFVYGKPPTDMLRLLSSKGPVAEKAAQRLVRLDHRVVNHRKLQRWIRSEPKVARFRKTKTQQWRKQSPFDKPKSKSYALRISAAYMSQLSELLGHRVKSYELRDVIQALGPEIPEDCQHYLQSKTTDDFSRELRRYRSHLIDREKPDKSTIEYVRALLEALE